MADCAALPLGVAGKADRDQERDAVEEWLDVELAAELLDTRDADGKDGDADDGAPHVHPPGLDGGRAEECPDQGGQQELEPDAGLSDAQASGEDDAGQSAE